jgi:hypothetical protein
VARKWLSDLPKATYLLAGLGIPLFVLGCSLQLGAFVILGVLLLAASALRLVPAFLTDIRTGEAMLSAISAGWAALFVAWCVVWLVVPGARRPLISLTVGMLLALGAFVLAYFLWRMEPARDRLSTRQRGEGPARHATDAD